MNVLDRIKYQGSFMWAKYAHGHFGQEQCHVRNDSVLAIKYHVNYRCFVNVLYQIEVFL